MSTWRRFGTALLIACGAATSVMAGKPSEPIPVTSIIHDNDTSVAPALQIRSDMQGNYVNSATTNSIITTVAGATHAAGDWLLDTMVKRSTRTVYLDFSQPIQGSAPGGGNPLILPTGLYAAQLQANCDLANTNLLTMPAGSVGSCPLGLRFTYAGLTYSLHMNPGVTTNGIVEWPETDYMNVTCLSSVNPCSSWQFTPSGTYTPVGGSLSQGNRTKLLLGTADDNGVDQGDFYMSFSMVVMK